MTKSHDPSARLIDSALAGTASAPELEDLSKWAAALRNEASYQIPEAVAANHIVSITGTASRSDHSAAQAPTPSRVQRVRRRLAFSSVFSGIVAKVFAASVAMATVTGGVVATGALPDSIQDPIAGLYNSVGFDFPTSECGSDDASCPEGSVADPADPAVDGTNGNGPGENRGSDPGENSGNEPGENRGSDPGENSGNGNGPGENNGNGPGENNGNGPGENNGNGPGENDGNRPGNGDDPPGQSKKNDQGHKGGGDEE